jgi:hypothetical protein
VGAVLPRHPVAPVLLVAIAGSAAFNEARLQQLQDPITGGAYLANADFWSRTLQNWQSEFFAVGQPHDSTGFEG